MKRYSLRRRLLAVVLALEFALALGISFATLFFTLHEQVRSFDLRLQGRADSLLGAVQDSEDAADNLKLDPRAIDLGHHDLWMVQGGGGRVIAKSSNWDAADMTEFHGRRPHTFRIHGAYYRGMVTHGIRVVDAEDKNGGIQRPVTIFYAASLHHVHEALVDASQFLLLANGVLLLVTGSLLIFFLRRGLAPLDHLNRAASELHPEQPVFRTPPDAADVEELRTLAATLESATKRLDESYQQQQMFLHNAAHELKTAVTIVKSSLQLLASRPRTPAEYKEGLEACLADSDRMGELVQSMLLLARLEQNAAPAEAACDLGEMVEEVAAQLATTAEARGIDVKLETDHEAWAPLDCDAASTLISNLMMNALQHSPAGTQLQVTTRVDGGEVELVVQDQGEGIRPEDQPHVFERFYRGDSSRARTTGGTGLGLAICKAIAESCGGKITLTSTPGEGTRMEVKLPRLQTRDKKAQARKTPAAVEQS
jgi:signal transduction histidine kinase